MSFFIGEASSPTLVEDLAPHHYENYNLNLNLNQTKN